MNKGSGKKIALTALITGVAGYVGGILTAPKAGRETRADIKKAANKALIKGEKQLKKLHSELKTLIDSSEKELKKLPGEAKKGLKTANTTAKKALGQAKDILSALHDGAASDKELNKAIKQAKQATANLKKYLRK